MTHSISPELRRFTGAPAVKQTGTNANPSQQDFAQLLLARMSMPDVSPFAMGPDESNASSFWGSSNGNAYSSSTISSILGGQSVFNSAVSSSFPAMNQASLVGGFSPQMEISVYSNLLDKTIDATDPSAGKIVSGKVTAIELKDGVSCFRIEGVSELIPTTNLKKAW